MDHKHLGDRLFVRLDRGDEVIASLTALCKDHDIGGASLTAIGAVKDAELGYYDLESFTYLKRDVPEVCELLGLSGNVALVDGEPFVHAHATLGRRDFSTLGGHLVQATVAVTVEVFLEPTPTALTRELDEAVKLKLVR
jgi:uncharacterized protein